MVIAVDVLIKTMLEAGLADLRQYPYLLDDVFSGLATDPLAVTDYGYKEVDAAKKWFLANNVEVYLNHRIDAPRFPCITIVQTNSSEMLDRAALGDDNGMLEDVDPKNKTITAYVQTVNGYFTPKAYDPSTGTITLPDPLDTSMIGPSFFLVSKRSGKAYQIQKLLGQTSFQIATGIVDDFTGAYVSPPTALWNLHRELTFMRESFAIGLHVQSDVGPAIWLRQIGAYIFLRYKEAYLEGRGFELSTFTIGAIDENPHYQGTEKIYSCPVTLEGQVEVNWIKMVAPKLNIVKGKIKIADGPRTPDAYQKEVQDQAWDMERDED